MLPICGKRYGSEVRVGTQRRIQDFPRGVHFLVPNVYFHQKATIFYYIVLVLWTEKQKAGWLYNSSKGLFLTRLQTILGCL